MTTTTAARDLTTKPPASAFALALVKERAKFHTSRHEVADHCGTSVAKVGQWEDGSAMPDVQTFKRLCGMFRRLASTPPNWGHGSAFGSMLDRTVANIKREAASIKEPEKVPEPESFGAGLKRIRRQNGMTQRELADVFDLAPSAVTNWEQDTNAPLSSNLTRLYEVLPELKTAIDIGAVKPPPIVRDWGGKPGPKDKPSHTVAKHEPVLAIVKPEPEPAPPPASLSAVAADYIAARKRWLQATRTAEELRGKLADAQLELSQATAAHDAALAAFDAVAAEPGK